MTAVVAAAMRSDDMTQRIPSLIAVRLLCATLFIRAQELPQIPTSTLTIQAKIVAVDAVVHTPDGDLIRNLDKGAFTLKVDGKPTEIRYFNRDNDLPLTIGLMVDTSESQSIYFDEEALSSSNFLTNILTNPKDQALVVRFDSRVLLLQKMTSRLNDLQNALRQLDYLNSEASAVHGATLLYDAIASVSKSVTSSEAGRRALVILTDGGDNGSHASLDDAIRQAQLQGVRRLQHPLHPRTHRGPPVSNRARHETLRHRHHAADLEGHRRPRLHRRHRHAHRRYLRRNRAGPPLAIPLRLHTLALEARQVPLHRPPHRRQASTHPGPRRLLHTRVAILSLRTACLRSTLLALLALPCLARAQEAPPASTFSVNVRVVAIDALVRDRSAN